MLDVILGVVSLVISILGFYIKRLYTTVDRNTEDIKRLSEKAHKELDQLNRDLTSHRVEDAAKYVSRQELDQRFHDLRDDIRGMISPIRQEMQNIGNYLREHKN